MARSLPPAGSGEELRDGELILICDIGGGTSDFSLVRAHLADGELQFERTAIGEHLLLGGDNLDFALARRIEEKLEKLKEIKLTLRQRYALRRACCAAKERLLSDSSLERVPVTLLGSGRSVVGQALSVDLTREEVLQILTDGFLPITAPDEMPARGRSTGLRELGLPYAGDPAITKHLAAFLTQAAITMNTSSRRPAEWLGPMPCFSMAASARRWSLASGLWRQSPHGSAERKAAGGLSCSTTKRSRVRWLVVRPTMAAYGGAAVRVSGSAMHARTTLDCLPATGARTKACRASVFCPLESKRALRFRC